MHPQQYTETEKATQAPVLDDDVLLTSVQTRRASATSRACASGGG